MTPPLIFSWFDHTLNTRTNLKRIIGIRPHTTSRLNQYTVLPPLPLSILSESLIILFQPQVPQISHTLDKQGYFPSDLARIKMPFQWEDSRILYGLQMIDMALFMCGRASGIDSAKKLNDGDKGVIGQNVCPFWLVFLCGSGRFSCSSCMGGELEVGQNVCPE